MGDIKINSDYAIGSDIKIRTKILTGTVALGSTASVATGISAANVYGYQVLLERDATSQWWNGQQTDASRGFSVYISGTDINFEIPGTFFDDGSVPYRIIIWYID